MKPAISRDFPSLPACGGNAGLAQYPSSDSPDLRLACNFFWSLLIALKLTLPGLQQEAQGFPITRDHPIIGSPDC
jgi:hypothetical protein